MDMKTVYETLDTLEDTMTSSIMHAEGELAELLMALTGTVVEDDRTELAIPKLNPDLQSEARHTVLRWLTDHGYLSRPADRVKIAKGHPQVFDRPCGNLRSANDACRAAYREGRIWHVIPPVTDARREAALVLPTYHFRTPNEGLAAVEEAMRTAPMVATDEDLERYRSAGVAYRLPPGWIDPSRR